MAPGLIPRTMKRLALLSFALLAGTSAHAQTCEPPPRAADAGHVAERNLLGAPLTVCSTQPLTGYFRDGRCVTGPEDLGVHVVCAQVTEAFLTFTRDRGNDLVTPRPGFAGLRPGDRWCLCASRWTEARAAGAAPPVVLEATSLAALRHAPREVWSAHALTRSAGTSPR